MNCKHCEDEMFRNPLEQEPTEYTDKGFCSESCQEEDKATTGLIDFTGQSSIDVRVHGELIGVAWFSRDIPGSQDRAVKQLLKDKGYVDLAKQYDKMRTVQ